MTPLDRKIRAIRRERVQNGFGLAARDSPARGTEIAKLRQAVWARFRQLPQGFGRACTLGLAQRRMHRADALFPMNGKPRYLQKRQVREPANGIAIALSEIRRRIARLPADV